MANVFVVKNVIGRLLGAPGGRTTEEISAAARLGFLSLQSECMDELKLVLGRCESLMRKAGVNFNPIVVDEFHEVIVNAIGLPTAGQDHAIDTVLLSMSDLMESFHSGKTWDVKAVEVHVTTLKILIRTEGDRDMAMTEEILEGLKKVKSRYIVP